MCWSVNLVATFQLLDLTGWRTVFQFFLVTTCADSLVPISPWCVQHTLRPLLVLKIHCPSFEKRRSSGWWLSSYTQITHNNGRIIRMMIVATSFTKRSIHLYQSIMLWNGNTCTFNKSLSTKLVSKRCCFFPYLFIVFIVLVTCKLSIHCLDKDVRCQ